MPVVTNVEDLRQLAKRRVAKAIFDYVDRGSYDEATLRANRADLEALTLRQRVAIDVDRRSLRTTLVGHDATMPVAIAPTGLTGLNWADGEMLGARAAERFGVPFTLSTMSICSIEDVGSAGQFDPTLSWKDVEWVKNLWGGKLILKGILDAEDAKIAASSGADAIVVSNHGGRQLDGAASSIRALPEVVSAAGGRIEVLFDGGIRSGQDVLKALALGARGVLIGRAFLYGLGALGEKGVTSVLEIIRSELDVTMALCGLRDVKDASPAILRR